jgi:hypothetical protein
MCIYGSPWGRLSFKAVLFETAKSNVDMGLKERFQGRHAVCG